MSTTSALCLRCRSFGYPDTNPPICFLCKSQMVLIADPESERVIWKYLQATRTDLPPETAAMSVAERELESLRRSMSTARTMFAQALRRHGRPTCSDGGSWDHQFLSCIADHVDHELTKDRERILELETQLTHARKACWEYADKENDMYRKAEEIVEERDAALARIAELEAALTKESP